MADKLKFIGTATTIITLGKHKILVDPSFLHSGDRLHLGWGIFSTKQVDPIFDPTDLEAIDLVLLTHNHRDHWDEEATRILDLSLPIITTDNASSFLKKQGFSNVQSLSSGQSMIWHELVITALPAHHGPWFMRPFTGQVIGFGIETEARKLWISGDTIATSTVKEAVVNYQPDAAIIYFGAVRAYGIRITFNGGDSLKIVDQLQQLKKLIGVHIDDWSHFKSDPQQLIKEFASHGLNLQIPKHGSTIEL